MDVERVHGPGATFRHLRVPSDRDFVHAVSPVHDPRAFRPELGQRVGEEIRVLGMGHADELAVGTGGVDQRPE